MGKSAVDVLSNISGMTKADIKKIANDVRKNNEKLNNCQCHNFCIQIEHGYREKFKCENCGGIIDGIMKKYYELGLEHSKYSSYEYCHCEPHGNEYWVQTEIYHCGFCEKPIKENK